MIPAAVSSKPPKVLLVCTVRWFATARLAKALLDAGCELEAVCPIDHPIGKLRAKLPHYRYHPLMPELSIGSAIAQARPDFVIPCDDLATQVFHRLYERARRAGATDICDLFERSLGDAEGFPVTTSRARLMSSAAEVGVRVPTTVVAQTLPELDRVLNDIGFPCVLKTDGTFGGRGVRIVRSRFDATRTWRTLSSPPSPARAIKRALINRDGNYLLPSLRRTRPVLNVQQFVSGGDANSTVACRGGRVLASITVAVVETLGEQGPSSVVQIIDNPEITQAVAKIVGHLKLTGLFGFDFVLERMTGDPYLIEMNPRATQICHVPTQDGRDLAGALAAELSGVDCARRVPIMAGGLVSFFPQEWLRDPESPSLQMTYHDVPWDEPELIRACIDEASTHRVWDAWWPTIGAIGYSFRPIDRSTAEVATPTNRPEER